MKLLHDYVIVNLVGDIVSEPLYHFEDRRHQTVKNQSGIDCVAGVGSWGIKEEGFH